MNTNRTGKNLDSRCKAKTKKGKAAEKESKLRLTKVEKPLPTQSREGGPTNYGAAHESGKESEPRPTKIEERLPAESREAGPITNNTAAPGLEKESEQRVAKDRKSTRLNSSH